MAFANRIGNVLKQTMSKHVNVESCGSNSMLYQAIRSMSSKLFVGGLSYGTDDTSLSEAFSQHGQVVEARVITDRDNGRSRGFGFVTFASDEEAARAMQAWDGQDLHGRRIRVNYATERPRAPRYDGGYGGGGSGGGGFGYGGSYGGGGYDKGNYGSNSSYGGGSNYGREGGGYGNGVYSSGGNQGAGGGTDLFSGGPTNRVGFDDSGYDGNPQEESFNVDDEPEMGDSDFKDENDEPNDFVNRKV